MNYRTSMLMAVVPAILFTASLAVVIQTASAACSPGTSGANGANGGNVTMNGDIPSSQPLDPTLAHNGRSADINSELGVEGGTNGGGGGSGASGCSTP